MSSTKNHREQIMLTILPAAVALAIYAFIVAIPAQSRYQANMLNLRAAQRVATDTQQAANAQANLEIAQSALRKLHQQLTDDQYQIVTNSRTWRSLEDRLETVQKVTELLRQFDLSILNQDFETQPPLSNYLQDLADIIDNYSPDEKLEYWQIELEGGYSDMAQFLWEIKSSATHTFPLSLHMNASITGDGVHTWTLLFVV